MKSRAMNQLSYVQRLVRESRFATFRWIGVGAISVIVWFVGLPLLLTIGSWWLMGGYTLLCWSIAGWSVLRVRKHWRSHRNARIGHVAETTAQTAIHHAFSPDDWWICHDIPMRYGNIDHLICHRRHAYCIVVETKAFQSAARPDHIERIQRAIDQIRRIEQVAQQAFATIAPVTTVSVVFLPLWPTSAVTTTTEGVWIVQASTGLAQFVEQCTLHAHRAALWPFYDDRFFHRILQGIR